MSRRRLSTHERRAAILAAAETHFTGQSYPDVSVAAIAADSGSSQALVFHYFATKSGLFTALIDAHLTHLRETHLAALAALTPGQPVRQRVEAILLAHLNTMAATPLLIAGPGEPEPARDARLRADNELAELLAAETGIHDFARHRWAVTGIVGFLGRAAAEWATAGCPAEERHPLVEATLGALEGALGDWQV